jgi:charged multivesicular body protein 4
MNLFGKARAAKVTPKDAILKLQESLDMLEKREKYLGTKIENELKIAKMNATKNKRGELKKVVIAGLMGVGGEAGKMVLCW